MGAIASKLSEIKAMFEGSNKMKVLALIVSTIVAASIIGIYIYFKVKAVNAVSQVKYVKKTGTGVRTDSMTSIETDIKFKDKFLQPQTIMFWAYINKLPDSSSSLLQIGRGVYASTEFSGFTEQRKMNICFIIDPKSSHLDGQMPKSKPALEVSFPCSTENSPCDATTVRFPYLPSKRWVHIAITINPDQKKMIGYLDADNVIEATISSSEAANPIYTDLVIGSTTNKYEGMISQCGFIGKVLSQSDIHAEYLKGPIDSKVSRYGIPSYGVRNPVYKVDK